MSRIHTGSSSSCWWTFLCNMETAYPVDFSRAYEKNSGCAAWKHELCSSSVHSVPAQMIIALTGRLQCIQIKRIWPRMQWAQLGTHISRRRAHIQNNQGHQRQPNQCKNNWIAYPNGAQTSDFWSIQTDTNTVKHSWQQNRRQSDTSNHIWWSCDRTHKSSGLRIHFDWPTETRGNNNTEAQERPQSGDFFIFESVVHSVTDNGLGFTDKSPEAA